MAIRVSSYRQLKLFVPWDPHSTACIEAAVLPWISMGVLKFYTVSHPHGSGSFGEEVVYFPAGKIKVDKIYLPQYKPHQGSKAKNVG